MNIELYIKEYINFIDKNRQYIASTLPSNTDISSYYKGQVKVLEDIMNFIYANKDKTIEDKSHNIQFKNDEVDN